MAWTAQPKGALESTAMPGMLAGRPLGWLLPGGRTEESCCEVGAPSKTAV